MAKERADGAEEREASDGSVEEISEEDFKHDGGGRASRPAKVWRSSDYVQFPRYLSQNQMFSSFAWMQAVKNKPLVTYGYGQAAAGAEVSEVGKEEVCVVSDSGEEDGGAVEREEGELEEGEIDDMGLSEVAAVDDALDAATEEATVGVRPSEDHLEEVKKERMPDGDGGVESREEAGAGNLAFVSESMEMDMELDEPEDFDQHVSSTLEDLEAITEEEVEKSFDGACSKLLRASKRLQKMVVEGHGTYIDAIIQHAFISLETIHSVYSKTKEKNKDVFARFILCIQSLRPSIFVAEQMKEICHMVPSLDSEKVNKAKVEQVSLTPEASSMGTEQIYNAPSLHVKLPMNKSISSKRGMEFGPLLDPHAVHDEDSLPSPTRETGPSLVAPSASFLNQNTSQQANMRKQQHDKTSLPYVTDALKAVSSYHKKYDRISFFSNDQLPSPTPSEDGDNGDNDMNGEVSSTPSVRNMTSMDPSLPFFSSGSIFGSRGVFTDSSSAPRPDLPQTVNPINYGSSLVSKVSAKSRDPRLKLTGSTVAIAPQLDKQSMGIESDKSSMGSFPGGTVDPRKHKAIGGPAYSDYPLKRPKNDFVNANDSQSLAGRGGWLENNGSVHLQPAYPVPTMGGFGVENRKPENGGSVWGTSQDTTREMDIASVGTNRMQSTSSVKDVASLLKDIAQNPNLLLNLLKELPGLAAENQKQPSNSAQNILNKPIMQVPSQNISSKNDQYEQKMDGRTPIPGEVSSSMNPPIDAGKVRMKPRDPRRILQNSMIQKNEQLPSQHLKGNGPFTVSNNIRNDNASVRDDGEQAQISVSVMVPEFPKNLRINSNMLPTPQIASIRPTAPVLNVPSNSTKIDGVVAKAAAEETNDPQISSSLAGERMPSDASHSSDPWGDVDHLLDGYDDRQKAAIQRERAKRIEEQNKMFAARKLSLVLDLDHTLLNSAKFVEVDPMHEEILRKKEELDRERPQRHLFRFQHMGMWTKLRPGIWNFLEKASKLYELHLYTMGNHLYATEMAKVLDPTGELFAGRVISKGDENELLDGDERLPKTKDLEGVMGMESAVVIIDDSVKVWPHNRLNLIVVERYTYFPCSRRQFGLMGPSLLEIDHDERPEDGTLASSSAVIERIHQSFFSHPSLNSVDVRNILAAEQRKILAGCRIVFSRIFPVGEANPHLHPLWQTAEQFGAVCTNQIDDQVTHVVANSLGTDKVNWALSTGRYVVHHGWVEASALLYRRANEHDFAVKP